MSESIRYRKPNMAALPPELGRSILRTIRNTPPTDYEKLQKQARQWENEAKTRIQERLNAEEDTAN